MQTPPNSTSMSSTNELLKNSAFPAHSMKAKKATKCRQFVSYGWKVSSWKRSKAPNHPSSGGWSSRWRGACRRRICGLRMGLIDWMLSRPLVTPAISTFLAHRLQRSWTSTRVVSLYAATTKRCKVCPAALKNQQWEWAKCKLHIIDTWATRWIKARW